MTPKRLIAAWLCVLFLAVAAVAVGGCGDSGSNESSPPTNPQIQITDMRGKKTVDVDAKDNVFDPNGIQVDVGTTVTWTNTGQVVHNVLPMSDQENFGGSTPFGVQADKFAPGDTYSFTFATAGTYNYACTLHTGMIGRVLVG
jgi:plastocyanin